MNQIAPILLGTDFVTFWNRTLAPKMIRFRHILVDGLTLHSEAVFPRLAVRPGDRVADIGCGFGDTAIKLARQVGPYGHVTGFDCCGSFIDLARLDAVAAHVPNASFRKADAERALPKGTYDFIFARFGTMFFANPVAGLRTMRLALKPGGRMTHIVWAERAANPWFCAARDHLLTHLPPPPPDNENCGPGPFSMSDPDQLGHQMRIAGYEDIRFERVETEVLVGRDIEEAIGFTLALGPAGEIFRAAGDLAETKRSAIEADLATHFASQRRDASGIWMQSASWIVSARNPH